MNTKEIELLICGFEEMSVVVKNHLSQAIGVISEGKILSEQLETELNNSLSELKNQYKFIKERVSELVDASVIPEEIIAAKNFTDIIKENERIKYERELTKAREGTLRA